MEDREPINKFSWPRDIQYFGDFYHKHIDKLRYFEILKKIDDLIFPKSGTIYFDEYRYFRSLNVNFEYLTNIANFGIAISDTIMFISEYQIFAVLLDYYHVSGTHGEHDYSIAVNSKDAHDLIPNCFSESS